MFGAAKMLRETQTDPNELRRQVTSPNGTTMAAITSLEEAQTQELFVHAVKQATKRAGEMGKQADAAFSSLRK
jgi:pyrroline-5-carboxylate reductase